MAIEADSTGAFRAEHRQELERMVLHAVRELLAFDGTGRAEIRVAGGEVIVIEVRPQ